MHIYFGFELSMAWVYSKPYLAAEYHTTNWNLHQSIYNIVPSIMQLAEQNMSGDSVATWSRAITKCRVRIPASCNQVATSYNDALPVSQWSQAALRSWISLQDKFIPCNNNHNKPWYLRRKENNPTSWTCIKQILHQWHSILPKQLTPSYHNINSHPASCISFQQIIGFTIQKSV